MKPQIYVDGKKAKIVPECSSCGKVAEKEKPPSGWEFNGYYGWLCEDCQKDYSE